MQGAPAACRGGWAGWAPLGRTLQPPAASRPLPPLPVPAPACCAAAQFCWEKWEVVKERVRMSDYCKKQW